MHLPGVATTTSVPRRSCSHWGPRDVPPYKVVTRTSGATRANSPATCVPPARRPHEELQGEAHLLGQLSSGREDQGRRPLGQRAAGSAVPGSQDAVHDGHGEAERLATARATAHEHVASLHAQVKGLSLHGEELGHASFLEAVQQSFVRAQLAHRAAVRNRGWRRVNYSFRGRRVRQQACTCQRPMAPHRAERRANEHGRSCVSPAQSGADLPNLDAGGLGMAKPSADRS
eukprot:scaffold7620_cov277-Pinguiococcus_pyrenoidosus.AAC.4